MADEAEQLEHLARSALADGSEEAALALVAPAAARLGNARLWQFAALLQRSLDQHGDALRSFAVAARLAPSDRSIAHGYARVAREAGVESIKLFERALELSPTNGDVLIGLAGAKFASGRGAEAEADLQAALLRSPLWLAGHRHLAQLRSMLGARDRSVESVERALRELPDNPDLWRTLFDLTLTMGDFALLEERLGQAGTVHGPFLSFQAIASAELGQVGRADRLFAQLPTAELEAISAWHLRHLIRVGRILQAVSLVDRMIQGVRASEFWPYAYIVWRLLDDPRWEWLDCGGKLIMSVDLTDRLPSITPIIERLRSLHVAQAEYLDQSVRGGTQTDGPLLSRIEPEIRELRQAIEEAVCVYVARLPDVDRVHPLLKLPRDRPIRFAGSWSVWLRSAGYHDNHVHPQGWISSALYLVLPDRTPADARNAGFLRLGAPPDELGVDLKATRLIEPAVGQLVLFPSWMWHGTLPFENGERLTVAFDVKPPMGPGPS